MPERNWYQAIIAWFAHNSVAANLLMVCLLGGGIWSAYNIKKEFFPKLDTNMINIQVAYLGAAPSEVEAGVSIKIEEAIEDVEGIEEIISFAREGMGSVRVEVSSGYDTLEVLDKIKLRIDSISTFPAETEKPVISKTDPSHEVMWISITGDISERSLKEFAKTIRDQIVSQTMASKVQVVGARTYEISIYVTEETLQEYGLTLAEVAESIRRGSLDLPGGSIKTEAGDILVRTKGQAYTGLDFEKIIVRTNADGSRLRVSDIAVVNDGFIERDHYSRFNGKAAVSIRVLAVGNQSELELAKQVKEYIDSIQSELPEGVKLAYWADISYYLKDRLDMMNKNLFFGAFLVFGVLALFLRLKLAFWVMVGLPVAFMGALWVMQIPGVSINMLSLFGFILVLGIVVDDAIVIGESVYSTIREKGHSEEAVVEGVMKVAVPATFGVLTTIAAFLPILLVSGVSGQLFAAIGWVVILCLLFSIVESKLILPAHLAHMKIKPPNMDNPLVRFQRFFAEGLHNFADNSYSPMLARALKRPYLTLASFIAILILSIGLITGGFLRVVFFPDFAGDFIMVDLEMNDGTSASETHRAMEKVSNAIRLVDQEMSAEIGRDSGAILGTVFSWSGHDTGGDIVVELVKSDEYIINAPEVTRRWRKEVGEIPGIEQLSFSSPAGPGSGGPAVAFRLISNNNTQMRAAAFELEQKIREYDGINDVRNSFEGGAREIKLHIRPEAQALGLSLSDLARQVRQGFYGEEIQRIQRGQDEVKVMVRYPVEKRNSVGYLEAMRIRTPAGDEIPFSTVADIEMTSAPTVIRRFNSERSITISAEVDKEIAEPGKIADDIRENFMPELLASYPDVKYRLDGATAAQKDTLADLINGGILALFLIYALMAIPLRSYLQPLLIMSVIPFGIIGALFGHWMLNLDISMLSILGIIALGGVVVNDSLILVDFVNRGRREGLSVMVAAQKAARTRFRAIVLTSLTTFLGLMPIILFEKSLQAQAIIPMAASLAFGILFATVITLFLIPTLYLIQEDWLNFMRRLLRRDSQSKPTTKET
ncbi:MAG: efflux RND transporter permease subunit [Xanthomonadales bacterium]|nr:efflux RND transporter permease subunit [Xanthomonadales bacterium]